MKFPDRIPDPPDGRRLLGASRHGRQVRQTADRGRPHPLSAPALTARRFVVQQVDGNSRVGAGE